VDFSSGNFQLGHHAIDRPGKFCVVWVDSVGAETASFGVQFQGGLRPVLQHGYKFHNMELNPL